MIFESVEKHFRKSSKNIELEKLLEYTHSLVSKKLDNAIADRFLQQTPPFKPLTVEIDGKQTNFASRKIVTALERLGIGIKEAFAIAGEVKQSLRSKGYERISERELNHQIALILEAKYGFEMRNSFESNLARPMHLTVLEPDQGGFPFSRGILSRSLMLAGFDPELSYAFAKQIEDNLWHENIREIKRSDLRAVVRKLVKTEAGEGLAERYNLTRKIRHHNKPIIILIGGAPGVGKSTLARELAYRLGIRRVVSSDAIREALRSLISPQLSPSLHTSSYTAWKTMVLPSEDEDNTKPKKNQVIRGFLTQVQQLNAALLGIIERSITENASVVVEGVHLVPGFLSTSLKSTSVIELTLITGDAEAHKSHFVNRDLENKNRGRERYFNHFREIRILNDYYLHRAEEIGSYVIDTKEVDESVYIALEHILNAVLTSEHVEEKA